MHALNYEDYIMCMATTTTTDNSHYMQVLLMYVIHMQHWKQ